MAQSAAVDAPQPPALTRRQINLVFGTILLGMLLAALDQTIVSTALPTIVGDLGGGGHVSWVVTSYLITDTIAVVLAGKFGDLFGRKLRLPGQRGDLRRRLDHVRRRRLDGVARRLARGAGRRRRRADGHRDRADRRHRAAARTRQVPRRARRRLRGHHRHRAAAGRPVHRPPLVALVLPGQRAAGHPGDRRRRQDHAVGADAAAADHRLRGHRRDLAGGRWSDPGHQPRRHRVRLALAA